MSDFINTVDIVGEDALIDSIISRTITEIADDSVTAIGFYAFEHCTLLTEANFPVATSIGYFAFANCSKLTKANIPAATSIGNDAFRYCTSLAEANFPVATSIGSNAFFPCASLAKANFPVATRIGNYAFENCTKLTALILRSETMCALSNTNAFSGNAIAKGTGYVYVPRALLSDTDAEKDYRRATNWSTYATQFRALEDYTVDGTTTGELDETKIAA